MDRVEILLRAHRDCWEYKQSTDPNHSDTYKFNEHTILIFANKLIEAAVLAEREACAKVCDDMNKTWEIPFEAVTRCAAAIRARSDHG